MLLTRRGIGDLGNLHLKAFLKATGLTSRGGKPEMQGRLIAAFDGAGVCTWKWGDRSVG